MSEEQPGSLNLKLKLKSTDTSRFKTDRTIALADKPASDGVSADATVPTAQVNDPMDSMRSNTGRLKKVAAGDTSTADAVAPQAPAGAAPMMEEKKNETVKLKVMKAPGIRMPGPATQAPVNLGTPAAETSTTPVAPRVSTATASIKMPTLRTGGALGGVNLGGVSAATGSTVAVPAPEKTVQVEAPAAPKVTVSPLTVKVPLPKVGGPESAAGATQVAEAPAAPAAPSRSTSTLKIRPVVGVKPGVNTGAASSTLKITPVGAAQAPAAPAAPAAPVNGEPQLKQTGIKLSLKKSEEPAAPAAPQAPVPPVPPAGNGAPQVVQAPAPGAGGLKLKKLDAAATVAAPVMETVKPAASDSAATIAVEPMAKPAPAGEAPAGTDAPAAPEMPAPVPEYDVPLANAGIGKLQAICGIVATLALGAACYFIVMDFLRFI